MENTRNGKQFVILFTDPHIVYSPSTLNIFYKLRENFDVKLISARQSNYYTQKQIFDKDIEYLDFNASESFSSILRKLVNRMLDRLFKPSEKTLIGRKLNNYKTATIIKYIKKSNREIIAVDFMALWCVQQVGKKAHLLSLEIDDHDPYYRQADLSSINSVIIQSTERLDYLFPSAKPKYFIVQNAPKNIRFSPDFDQRLKTNLIFCGSAVLGFGIISCLDFIKDYKEYTLTIKGAFPKETEEVINQFYSDLLSEQRLKIETDYLSESDLTNYISNFRIGFAFYDLYRFTHLKTFNYLNAPSGKVFQYMNSAIPVIANKLPGFSFIPQNKCGVLINYLSSQQIKAAIDIIESDYLMYAQNAKAMSYRYDFNVMIKPFLEFIQEP